MLFFWRRFRLPTPVFWGFPCGSAGKESACNVEGLGLIPRLGRSPGEGKGYPLQYSGLENSMGCIVHGVAKSQTLRNFHFHSPVTGSGLGEQEWRREARYSSPGERWRNLAVVEVEEEVTFDILCTCASSLKLIAKTFQFKSTFQLLAMESRRLIIPTLLD